MENPQAFISGEKPKGFDLPGPVQAAGPQARARELSFKVETLTKLIQEGATVTFEKGGAAEGEGGKAAQTPKRVVLTRDGPPIKAEDLAKLIEGAAKIGVERGEPPKGAAPRQAPEITQRTAGIAVNLAAYTMDPLKTTPGLPDVSASSEAFPAPRSRWTTCRRRP